MCMHAWYFFNYVWTKFWCKCSKSTWCLLILHYYKYCSGFAVDKLQSYSTAWNHMHIGTCEPQEQNACIARGRNETKPHGSRTKPARFTRENLGSKFISVKWTKWRHKRIVLAIVFLLFSFPFRFPFSHWQLVNSEIFSTGSSGIV